MAADIQAATYADLTFCPASPTAADEDWYGIPISTPLIIKAEMKLKEYSAGQGYHDVDLMLTDSAGTAIEDSDGVSNTEYVSGCFPASAVKAYLRAYTAAFLSSNVKPTKYDLTVMRIGPDGADAVDNNANTNFEVGPTGATLNQNICGSEDWLWTIQSQRTHLVFDLQYTARLPHEKLTVRLERETGSGDPPPSTQVATGAPIDGGMRLTYDTPDGGDEIYYIVVGGPDAAANSYTLKSVQVP
jgi:hypothetical protein